MGDTFEVAVDVEATLDEAPRLANTVIEWLTAEGVLDATLTDDRDLWGAGYYRPGPNHRLVVAHPDHPYVTGFAESNLGRLKVVIGRRVFVPVQGEPGPAVCPLCGYAATLTDPATGRATEEWELFSDALGDWNADGPGIVHCPNDGSAIAINEWQWQGEWPIAVGHLGFEFWNWPILHPTSCPRSATDLVTASSSPEASCSRKAVGQCATSRQLSPSGPCGVGGKSNSFSGRARRTGPVALGGL